MNAPGDKLYRGSHASKFLGGMSFLFLIFCGLMLPGRHWLLTAVSLTVSIVTAFAGYKLSGGRENPALKRRGSKVGVELGLESKETGSGSQDEDTEQHRTTPQQQADPAPVLYSDLDLFGLIAYAVRSANARIGFHSQRSQEKIINTLEHAGFPVSSAQDVRQEIRNVIAKDRGAFKACRDTILIQMYSRWPGAFLGRIRASKDSTVVSSGRNHH